MIRMRASTAVGLLFAGSMSIFGIFSTNRHRSQALAIEPVWVNGQEGVYSPSTGEFVPTTSWDYADVCDEIRQQRAAAGIYGTPTTGPSGYTDSTGIYHSYHYYGSGYGYYGGSGYTGSHSMGSSSSSSSMGSARGGIGGMGHAHGGGGGE
jgi:hypothetical protein